MMSTRMQAAASGGRAYLIEGVVFDGVNDYMTSDDDLGVDGKEGILSFWAKINQDGATFEISEPSGGNFGIRHDNGNRYRIQCWNNTNNTLVMRVSTDLQWTISDGWHHVLVSWNNATGFRELYIDDVDDKAAGSVSVNQDCGYDSQITNMVIGAAGGGGQKFVGDVADFYFNSTESLDITVESNRRKFIDSDGKPVDLGSDGSTPTGTQATIFCTVADGGVASDFNTNQGSVGAFTTIGALTLSSTSPSD